MAAQIEYVAQAPPAHTLIMVASNTLEVVARDLKRADPEHRDVIVTNGYCEVPLDPDVEFFDLESPEYDDYQFEGDAEVKAHLFHDRRGTYVRSPRGIPGSWPHVAYAATVRKLPALIQSVHEHVRSLARKAGGLNPTVYVVLLAMDTAGTGNGASVPISVCLKRVQRLMNRSVNLHTITIIVESTVHDDLHDERVLRQIAYKATQTAIMEASEGLRVADIELVGPLSSEMYYIDAPGGRDEATETEIAGYVYEMVNTMLHRELRTRIDGAVQQWADFATSFGAGAPIAGPAGHVVARFDREPLAKAGVVYQMPSIFAWLSGRD